MNLEKYLNKLYSLHTFGVKLGLENIQGFLDHLGNPQRKLKAFHIAGSNGKGSTASFIASILSELHFKVGLYTSPHFVRFNERIQVLQHGKKNHRTEIPDEYIAGFIAANEKFIDDQKLTFFEVTTALAFKYFCEQNVDYAVIETGLGGRLDATNVLSPLGVIITSISLEHTNLLGDTIEKIAAEKAAIIKKNAKVFVGKIPDEAFKVIENRCIELGCELFPIQDFIIETGNMIELYTEEMELDDWTMPLKGNYQKYNAALAVITVSKTLNKDNFGTINHGIKNVVTNTGLQGRYEFYFSKPDIIFDSAHNPESVEHFLSEFAKEKEKYSKRVLLFGAMKDKAIKEMLQLLRNFFEEVHVTTIGFERASTLKELKSIAEEIKLSVFPEENPISFVRQFEQNNPGNCLVVLGSMYLLGVIKSSIMKNKFA
ncbi:MAG TPA: folylpolyglutamate synthase/dihydrofolate synthase family protein [Ignavibacteriaceae bacterium]|nr:folylpolyglutamate synthase/dihydrofolate synthase family protein [Ignavibacteriaceae bacterium]